MPLHGHRKSRLLLSTSTIRNNCLNSEQGFIRALLSLLVDCGNTTLLNHVDTSPKNYTMISPRIQNKIIVTVRDVIVQKIMDLVRLRSYSASVLGLKLQITSMFNCIVTLAMCSCSVRTRGGQDEILMSNWFKIGCM